ncbi:MAG: putative ATPase/DNA-binding winged helix-turn-helix (wHTH) protein [Myxococcota bacterium]|jgi:predicted ATPase/DNA-binding winged helix-turn-helix (wHTH) protein
MRWVLDGGVLDLERGQLRRGASATALTPQEVALLRYLGERSGQVVSQSELLEQVWGYHQSSQSRAVSKALYRLRDKIEPDPSRPRWLHTLRGQGCRFTPPKAPTQAATPDRPLTSLLGREVERASLKAWLAEGAWLLTLLGPGGIGKTRLALWALAEAQSEGQAVCFCDLSGATTPAAMWEQLAASLGVKLSSGDAAETIGQAVAAQPRVLILDNLEGVIDTAAEVLAGWRQQGCGRILVTSRQPLRLSGEVILPIEPLPPACARALLVSRSGWPDSPLIGELSEQLDRIPLAIELVAAHGPLLPPQVAAERAGALLNRPVLRDGPAHHRTMHAAIDWSWQQLDAGQQGALARLAACGGPLSLGAAEAVVSGSSPLEVILSLAERSLLRWDGEQIALFTVIRDFAAAQLTDEDVPEALARLGRHVAREGIAARDAAMANSVNEAVLRVASMPALLAAWRAALASGDATLSCLLAYLVAEIRFGQLAHRYIASDLQQSLALPGAAPTAAARARYILGRSAATAGDFALASACFESVLDHCEQEDEPALRSLAWCAVAIHDQPGRDRLADAHRAVAVSTSPHYRARALTILGFVLRNYKQQALSSDALEEAARIFGDLGDESGVAWAVAGMSRNLTDEPTIKTMISRLRALEQRPVRGQAGIWIQLGLLLLKLGEPEEAIPWLEKSTAFHESSGDRTDWMTSRTTHGLALLELGRCEEGLALIETSHRVCVQMRSYHLWSSTGALVMALLMCGQPERALSALSVRPLKEDWEHVWMALTLRQLGEHDRAKESIARIEYPWFAAVLCGDHEEAGRHKPAFGAHARLLLRMLGEQSTRRQPLRAVTSGG